MGKRYSQPQSDGAHSFAMILRMLAITVMIPFVPGSQGNAQTTIVWSAFSSGMALQSGNGTEVVPILGETFFGSGSVGSIYISTGFGTYVLGKKTTSGAPDPTLAIPTVYSLSQNFPNPFNPSTTIEYGLPSASQVRLTVFDVLGRNIAILYDGQQTAGLQRIKWNAPVSTGVYFYRIVATSIQNPERRFVEVRKMLLMK